MKFTYQKTIYACFVGFITQAIVNNFAPLLFLMFHSSYGISISKITLLVTVNFALQLLVDLLAIGFVDKIGYRVSVVLAHVISAIGLIALPVLPGIFADSFNGLLAAVVIYAVGGGLLEVLISPIMEACPTDNKEKAMSMLHSFYCWGHVGVVLVSTLFFVVFGMSSWGILAVIWAVIPLANAFMFLKAPIAPLIAEGESGLTIKELVHNKLFWLFIVIMVCAGASEQAVSQWASAFAEQSLGVDKVLGDLMGPMLFALMMGLSRLYYGKYGERIHLKRFMSASVLLCIFSYLLIAISPWPVIGLLGCGLCGLSVGIMWPGTFSLASPAIKGGGTALFALLALAGDLGCSAGPTVVGMVSDYFNDNLKAGILAGTVFPLILLGALIWNRKR